MTTCLRASQRSWLFYCALILAPIPAARGGEPVPPSPQKLVVELKVVEVYTSKLRNLGFDWAQITPEGVKHTSVDLLTSSIQGPKIVHDQFDGFLEALRQNELARVLAEPTLATLDGRPASFEVAGYSKLDVHPIVLGNGHVKVEYRIEIAAPQPEPGGPTARREADSPAKPLWLDSATELEMGRWCLVGHTRANTPAANGKPGETETLVLVRVATLRSGGLR